MKNLFCKICTKKLQGQQKVTCSYECRNKLASISNQKYPQEKNCIHCGKLFNRGKEPSRKVCSKKCQYEMFSKVRIRVNQKSIVSYSAIHFRIERILGKPMKCWECGNENRNRFHWANLDGQYDDSKLDTWARLCPSCHQLHDKSGKKLILQFKPL